MSILHKRKLNQNSHALNITKKQKRADESEASMPCCASLWFDRVAHMAHPPDPLIPGMRLCLEIEYF